MAGFGPSLEQLQAVEDDLGYSFNDKWMLKQAFIHPSAGEFNNTSLAWMGDSAISTIASGIVMANNPGASPEVLTECRKIMVMRETCADIAKAKGWDRHVVLGKGFRKISNTATTNMLSELYEAVWGALYLDANGNLEDSYKRCHPATELERILKHVNTVKDKAILAREIAKAQTKKASRLAHAHQDGKPSQPSTPTTPAQRPSASGSSA